MPMPQQAAMPPQAPPQAPPTPPVQAPPRPQAGPPPVAPAAPKPVQADPQILALQQTLLIRAIKKIYEKDAFTAIVKGLKQYKAEPPEALANMALTIIHYVQGTDAKMPPKAAMLIGMPVLYIVADIADKAGIFKIDKGTVDQAFEILKKMVSGPPKPAQQAPQQATPPAAPQGLIGQPVGA